MRLPLPLPEPAEAPASPTWHRLVRRGIREGARGKHGPPAMDALGDLLRHARRSPRTAAALGPLFEPEQGPRHPEALIERIARWNRLVEDARPRV